MVKYCIKLTAASKDCCITDISNEEWSELINLYNSISGTATNRKKIVKWEIVGKGMELELHSENWVDPLHGSRMLRVLSQEIIDRNLLKISGKRIFRVHCQEIQEKDEKNNNHTISIFPSDYEILMKMVNDTGLPIEVVLHDIIYRANL